MSAGVRGKRRGFEELFGSSSSAAKRSRFSITGSSDEQVSLLLQMFPCLDPQLVENVLRSHDHKIEESVESLHALSYVDAMTRNEPHIDIGSAVVGNCSALRGGSPVTYTDMLEKNEEIRDTRLGHGTMGDGSKWVELFVKEMMNAADVNNARSRASRILVAFERSIASQPRATQEANWQQHASLKEHLQNLCDDNQILKKAIAIQHERHGEREQKLKEAQHLKQMLSQYQEQAKKLGVIICASLLLVMAFACSSLSPYCGPVVIPRWKLDLSNYALTIHLQRAQESNPAFGHFHPDIY